MTLEQLLKETTLYKVAQVLGTTPSSCYKWKKNGKIPPLRLYELKEKKPHWFPEEKNDYKRTL